MATSAPATAQSVSLGADIVSRYVWRGLDFGESMSVQPGLTVSLGKIEFGAWGSYSVSAGGTGHGHGAAANENDLWASFTHEFESGASLSLGVTDYYFPGPGADDFRDGDAHKQEVWASLSGSESVPLSVYAGLLLDDDEGDDCDEGEDCSTQTLYIEVGAPLMEAEGVELAAHLGVVGNESDFLWNGWCRPRQRRGHRERRALDHRILRPPGQRLVRGKPVGGGEPRVPLLHAEHLAVVHCGLHFVNCGLLHEYVG